MGKSSKQTTTRTPYDPAAVASANSTLAGANTQSQATMGQLLPGVTQRIQQQIAAPPQPYATDARTQLDKTINGDYLDPSTNPYSAGMADLIAKRTQGQYDATFGAQGRNHGGLAALLSGQGVGDALGSFYGGLYNTERGNQQQAIGMAPAFNADEYTGTNNLMNETTAAASLPLSLASTYGQGVTGVNSPYTTDTTTTKTPFNPLSAIGLAAQIGSAFIPGAGAAGGLAGLIGGGSSISNIAQGGFRMPASAYSTALPGLPRFLG